jgi:hypothetical protein
MHGKNLSREQLTDIGKKYLHNICQATCVVALENGEERFVIRMCDTNLRLIRGHGMSGQLTQDLVIHNGVITLTRDNMEELVDLLAYVCTKLIELKYYVPVLCARFDVYNVHYAIYSATNAAVVVGSNTNGLLRLFQHLKKLYSALGHTISSAVMVAVFEDICTLHSSNSASCLIASNNGVAIEAADIAKITDFTDVVVFQSHDPTTYDQNTLLGPDYDSMDNYHWQLKCSPLALLSLFRP